MTSHGTSGHPPLGHIALILHAHLPFVRHPEHPTFLEENWFFEAITETYIPLIVMFERLAQEGVPFRLTMTVTPPLAAMLGDELLRDRYARRIEQLIELAGKEVDRTRGRPPFDRLARMYLSRFYECRKVFNDWHARDLVSALRRFQDMGHVEIMASAATHAYLPLMLPTPKALRAQVRIGVDEYVRHFGREPAGFWLPECGYAPGIDEVLVECGIRYTVLETHGLAYAAPHPRFGVYAPAFCKSGLAVFARDADSSRQVWSAVEGYPGDHHYREFYRDAGYDLDYDYIRPYIHPDGDRMFTGIKYYRITGCDRHKEPYDPLLARKKAEEHAEDFVAARSRQVEHLQPGMGRRPIIVAPYDAELFGHWWYEGPDWLEFVLRKIAAATQAIGTTTPAQYLAEHPVNQLVTPCASSWGWKGYNEVWLEGSNEWVYPHLTAAAERMSELAATFSDPGDLERRALNQAARELLIAQSSDWAFIMKTRTATEYAVRRTRTCLARFNRLYTDLKSSAVDPDWLAEVETQDNLFPQLDYRVFR